MKTLIIGATTSGGIGEAVHMTLLDEDMYSDIYAPTIQELNVSHIPSIAAFLRMSGPFDEIVYSAGVNGLKWVSELTTDDLHKTFAVNTFGLALLMGQHERIFPDARGSVVAVVSDAAQTPMRGSLPYCASKAAEAMVVRCLARELSPRWRVNGVNPGVVEGTDMTRYIDEHVPGFRGWTPQRAREYENSGNLLGRRVAAHEVAGTVSFLLRGPDAINGEIIQINGGK